jgi:hypothetical protein
MYFQTVNWAPNQVQITSDIYVVASVNSLNPIQLYIYSLQILWKGVCHVTV